MSSSPNPSMEKKSVPIRKAITIEELLAPDDMIETQPDASYSRALHVYESSSKNTLTSSTFSSRTSPSSSVMSTRTESPVGSVAHRYNGPYFRQQSPLPATNTRIRSENFQATLFNGKELYKCPYQECRKKVWLLGFASVQDLQDHMKLHQCQWSFMNDDGSYKTCQFVPSNTDEAIAHIDRHSEDDPIPLIRPAEGRTLYFCPWSSCCSSAYCEKGSTNKAHVLLHIRKHLSVPIPKSFSQANSSRSR